MSRARFKIKTDILVLGAGASALMYGAWAKEKLLFAETNPFIGAKIKISGGGKCNITNENVLPLNYRGDRAFIKAALDRFTPRDTLTFFEKFGVKATVKKEGQYFCQSALSVLAALNQANKHHSFLFNKAVKNVTFKNGLFVSEFDDLAIESKKLVVALGGKSFAQLGASEAGFLIARNFGHEINFLSPALVGLSLQKEQFWMKELSGVSLRARLKCGDFAYEDDMLFSHKGISGPAVLNSSLRWDKGNLEIDFMPHFELSQNSKIWNDRRQPSTIFGLPKSFIKAFLSSLSLIDKPMKNYNSSEKELILRLKNYIMSPAGTFGFSRAEATKGGVDTDKISPDNFESKNQKGLFFIGEVLDVTGELGGYNLQWAWSSGFCAAQNL